MARINKIAEAWGVEIIESERGWGSKVDEVIYFDNKPEAEQYVKDFNARNNLNYVPDYYEYARGPYRVA